MSVLWRKNKTIDNWRRKAKDRGVVIRYLRKELNRLKQNLKNSKKKIKELEQKLADLSRKLDPVRSKEEVIKIALTLLVQCGLGYRAVSRVLEALCKELGISKAPCAQTIINWSIRLSVTKVQHAAPRIASRFANGFVFIVDAAICIGTHKICAVLAVGCDQYARHQAAPGLQDAQCVGIAAAASWNGDTIADLLAKVMDRVGTPQAIIKDNGSDFVRATNILGERGYEFACIDDISHFCANLLKHQYKDHPEFEIFLTACGKVSASCKQTVLACLAPPKRIVKSRFMNLHRQVKWADQLLKHCPKGRAAKGSVLAKLREALGELPDCKNFIKLFHRDASALLACQKVLKKKGLNNDTYQECLELLKSVPPTSPVHAGMTHWLDEHLAKAKELDLDGTGMLITSDLIESFFGKTKARAGDGAMKDANRLVFLAPAFCGGIEEEDARLVAQMSVREQQAFTEQLPSITKLRRQVLPTPGTLEQLASAGEISSGVELVPGVEKRAKNQENILNSEHCEEEHVPRELPKKPIKLREEIGGIEAMIKRDDLGRQRGSPLLNAA